MLGLKFPCGAELDRLSVKSDKKFKIKPTVKGLNVSLSGIENKAQKMLSENESKEDIAAFVYKQYIATVDSMLCGIIEKYGDMPIVFSAGFHQIPS
jgi:N6-L-threonylcarbamoyladenine synthase